MDYVARPQALTCKGRRRSVAPGGAHLAAERVGAERRRESEAQPNREGVASGSAT